MKKLVMGIAAVLVTVLVMPAIAFAHVVVTPDHAAVGEHVLFTVSVPNEKTVAMSSLKLTIPSGLTDVQPDVTAGWNITTATDGRDNITSITWTGTIPVGQRADLSFKAQAPAAAGELDWKATQTYADGSVVHWDQNPAATNDSSNAGPYSVTKVVNDLSNNSTNSAPAKNGSSQATLALVLSVTALALSISGLFLRRKR